MEKVCRLPNRQNVLCDIAEHQERIKLTCLNSILSLEVICFYCT